MVREVVTKMKLEAEHGTADILKWWTFMATDVSALLMFGDSFKMIERGEVSWSAENRLCLHPSTRSN